MSKENRKKEYERLIKEGKLSQDDGALVKEFGEPGTNSDTPISEPTGEPDSKLRVEGEPEPADPGPDPEHEEPDEKPKKKRGR